MIAIAQDGFDSADRHVARTAGVVHPSMAATILHPNLAAEYPALKQPQAAFLSVAMDVMPQGLLGLLLSTDARRDGDEHGCGSNKNVGIAIRSLYKPV